MALIKKKDPLREILTGVLHLVLFFPECHVAYLVTVYYCVLSPLILEYPFS